MAPSTSPVPAADAQFTSVWRVDLTGAKPAEPSAVEKAAKAQQAELQAQTVNQLLPGELLVEIDRASGRFVHTLKDGATHEVVWRYPSEAQLAFSRAVRAYAEAVAIG
jgi:hypothetical protein